jgi:hypothetical protein
MIVGLAFVVALWILAFRGFRVGAGGGLATLTVAWGAIVLVFGMTQTRILPGGPHWVIQTLHLLVGAAAMGFAGALGSRMKRTPARLTKPGAAGLAPAPGGE